MPKVICGIRWSIKPELNPLPNRMKNISTAQNLVKGNDCCVNLKWPCCGHWPIFRILATHVQREQTPSWRCKEETVEFKIRLPLCWSVQGSRSWLSFHLKLSQSYASATITVSLRWWLTHMVKQSPVVLESKGSQPWSHDPSEPS
jgi:hypothetical protein